jgi:glycosyltransferase involved in cell wall biosynthesis
VEQGGKKLKVNINTAPLSSGHAIRGIGVYTQNLITSLKKIKDIELVHETKNAEIIHYPYFDLFFHSLRINSRQSVIVTIHDVIPLLYPTKYPPGIRGKINFLLQKRELKKVRAILTDSETSKKDIVRFLDIAADNIFVTKLAARSIFKKLKTGSWEKDTRLKYNLPEKFILYVGDVNYNKNLLNLAAACNLLNTTLVIVGKQATSSFDKSHVENKAISNLIDKYGTDPKVLRLGFIEDEDLVKIYNLASVYCQPSLYEGFGFPVLEAMACGIPVACSKTQALVELAGESADYFDPLDPRDISSVLNKVLTDKSHAKKLVQLGEDCAKKYTWDKTADETYKVYKHVLQK